MPIRGIKSENDGGVGLQRDEKGNNKREKIDVDLIIDSDLETERSGRKK
jgi:hypothetical protein